MTNSGNNAHHDGEYAIVNHRLTVAYDGTRFYGWQRQGNLPTIQLAIEKAIQKCWKTPITLHGSGRTDQGVHAKGQIAHFIAPKKFTETQCANALNNNLPPEIRILEVKWETNEFHSRFSAVGKEYHYRICHSKVFPPFEINRSWHRPRLHDFDAIAKALKIIQGEHDFESFTSNPGYERETTVRNLWKADMECDHHDIITLRFAGNGFLYRMVRNLTGAIALVGSGKLSPEQIQRILDARNRSAAPFTAPACGLYLMQVFYHNPEATP